MGRVGKGDKRGDTANLFRKLSIVLGM